jgi:hypothetical protein
MVSCRQKLFTSQSVTTSGLSCQCSYRSLQHVSLFPEHYVLIVRSRTQTMEFSLVLCPLSPSPYVSAALPCCCGTAYSCSPALLLWNCLLLHCCRGTAYSCIAAVELSTPALLPWNCLLLQPCIAAVELSTPAALHC